MGAGVSRAAWRLLGALSCGLAGCALVSPPDALPASTAGPGVVSAPPGPLLAGAARVDVTPTDTACLGGFGLWRRSEGVHDPIWARALALRRGELSAVIVAVDVVGLHHHFVERVRARLRARVPPEAVLVAATHNHEGPDTMGLWGLPPFLSGIDGDYLPVLEDGVVAAASAALDALGPATGRWAQAQAPSEGVSRNKRQPDLIDRTVTVLALDRPDGAPVATLVHFACHPEVLGSKNRLITADFPAATVATVESGRGGGVAVYLNGALGGMVTADQRAHTFAEAERIGTAVGRVALEALHDARPLPSAVDLVAARKPLEVPIQNRTYHLLSGLGLLGGRPFSGGATPSEMAALRLGPLLLLTVPGEALPRVGFELEALWGLEPFCLVGLGNDELGYLIHEEDWPAERYRYERTVSPGPLTTTLLRRAAGELVGAVAPVSTR